MTEIRVDVDLEHPPSLVWRALTEAHLVTDWLPTTQFMIRDNGTFTFRAGRLEGLEDAIEGEIVTSEAPHRLVMRWEANNLHTVVAITLEERGTGTRFALTQSGFLGPQGAMRRRVLRATYTALFEGPLAATLARLAASSPPAVVEESPATVHRNDGGPFNRLPRQSSGPSHSAPGLSSRANTAGPRPTAALPGFAAAVLGAKAKGVAKVAPAAAEAPAAPVASKPAAVPTARRGGVMARGRNAARDGWGWLAKARDWSADRRSQAVAAGAAVLLLIAMIALLVGKATAPHPAGPPRTGGGTEGPALATVPAQPGSAPSPRGSAPSPRGSAASPPAPSPSPPASAPPRTASAPPELTAAYKTENLQLTSYRVTITISNPGAVPVTDWTIVTVLPLLDLTVRNVTGAVMARIDRRVIFTPVDSTRTIRAGARPVVSFEVEGLGVRNEPFNCTIDGRPCTPIPG